MRKPIRWNVLLLTLLIPIVMRPQSNASNLLDQEPEMVRVANGMKSLQAASPNPIAMAGILTGIRYQIDHLRNRLEDQLYECSDQCPERFARNLSEYRELKRRNETVFKIEGVSVEFPEPSSTNWADPRSDEERIATYLDNGCRQLYLNPKAISHDAPNVPDTPAQEIAWNRCLDTFETPGYAFKNPGDIKGTPLWDAYVAEWASCIGQYQWSKTKFEQRPYDSCMNEHHKVTRMCTLLRKHENTRATDCNAKTPTREDELHLKNFRGSPEESSIASQAVAGPNPLNISDEEFYSIELKRRQAEYYLAEPKKTQFNKAVASLVDGLKSGDTKQQKLAFEKIDDMMNSFPDRSAAYSFIGTIVLWVRQRVPGARDWNQ